MYTHTYTHAHTKIQYTQKYSTHKQQRKREGNVNKPGGIPLGIKKATPHSPRLLLLRCIISLSFRERDVYTQEGEEECGVAIWRLMLLLQL